MWLYELESMISQEAWYDQLVGLATGEEGDPL